MQASRPKHKALHWVANATACDKQMGIWNGVGKAMVNRCYFMIIACKKMGRKLLSCPLNRLRSPRFKQPPSLRKNYIFARKVR